MEEKTARHNEMNRRDFLKIVGISTAAAGLNACSPRRAAEETDNGVAGTPAGEMTCRQFPPSPDKVSVLGYGCMRWPTLPAPGGDGNVIDQEEVNRLVDYAIAHGVNYFDTAPVYVQGWSETSTGIALSRHPRDKYFIATKMSNFSDPDFGESVRMYRNSMKNLRTDYIDYYLLHSLGSQGARSFQTRFLDNGLLDFLVKEREAGRIRHLGWSFHGTKDEFDRILSYHETVHWDFIQIQLNYSDWKYATGRNVNADYLYAKIAERRIPMVIMEPLLGGRLAKLPEHVFTRLKARKPEASVASWAFRFAATPPMVLTVLSGMTYMEHLQDNIRTYSPLVPLTEEEKRFLLDTAALMREYPTVPCNDCQYCMPCPYGIDIPGVLLHYNKCVNEGNISQSRLDENYAEARRAFLVGYDRSVPKLRQASHCIGCAQCNPHCPQSIDIPKELQRIDRYVEQLKQNTL